MATGAANGMFPSIFEGCISGRDAAIERRPYHKNCGCALHERSSGAGKTQRQICRHGSSESISYPIRRSWSEGNLGLHLSASSSSSSNLQSLSASYSLSNIASPSPSGSPTAVAMDSSRYSHHLWWTIDEEEAHNSYSCSLKDWSLTKVFGKKKAGGKLISWFTWRFGDRLFHMSEAIQTWRDIGAPTMCP